jgi:hypothetical protein
MAGRIGPRIWNGREVFAECVSGGVSASGTARAPSAMWQVTCGDTTRAAFECTEGDEDEDVVWARIFTWLEAREAASE